MPFLTVTEINPGASLSFQSITAGPGSVSLDPVNGGLGLQSLTLIGSANANVSIPAFPFATFDPVTVTFTKTFPGLPSEFTLRAGSRSNSVLIRAQCSASQLADEPAVSRAFPPFQVAMPKHAAGAADAILSLLMYALGDAGQAHDEAIGH